MRVHKLHDRLTQLEPCNWIILSTRHGKLTLAGYRDHTVIRA